RGLEHFGAITDPNAPVMKSAGEAYRPPVGLMLTKPGPVGPPEFNPARGGIASTFAGAEGPARGVTPPERRAGGAPAPRPAVERSRVAPRRPPVTTLTDTWRIRACGTSSGRS